MAESSSPSFELDARLHVTAVEHGQSRQFPIGVPTVEGIELIIGRSRSVDLTIHDDFISNRHLKIAFRGGQHWLEDLGSTHGTKVNDKPVTAAMVLTTGDIVSLGKSQFEYRCTQRPLEEVGSIADYADPPAEAVKDAAGADDQQTGATMAQHATLNATRAAAAAKAADEAKLKSKPATAATPARPAPRAPAAAGPAPAKPQAAQTPAPQRAGFLTVAGALLLVVAIIALVCYLGWELFIAKS